METKTIYYDTKTGNVARFIEKISKLCPEVQAINVNSAEHFEKVGHLITFTTGSGKVPVTTDYFMQRYGHLILTVSASGNRNWGRNFAISANKISDQYNLPIALKFELAGLPEDVERYVNHLNNKTMKKVIKFEKDNCSPCEQVSKFLDSIGVQYEAINAFNEPDIAIKHKVRTVPTVLVMDGETEVKRIVGFNPNELKEIV